MCSFGVLHVLMRGVRFGEVEKLRARIFGAILKPGIMVAEEVGTLRSQKVGTSLRSQGHVTSWRRRPATGLEVFERATRGESLALNRGAGMQFRFCIEVTPS